MATNQGRFKALETKWFWLYWVVGAVLLTLGIFLLPVWSGFNVFWRTWSRDSIDIILFILVALYVAYLISRIDKGAPKTKVIISVSEIVALVVIAILCLLQQLDVMRGVMGPAFVLGFVVWARGIVFVLDAHFFGTNKKGGALVWLAIGLLAVTFGAASMVRPVPQSNAFIWIISILIILLAFGVILLGIFSIPKKRGGTPPAASNPPASTPPAP